MLRSKYRHFMFLAIIVTILNSKRPQANSDAVLIASPRNIAVIEGSKVRMECRTDSSAQLIWRTKWGLLKDDWTIFNGNTLTQYFTKFYTIHSDNAGWFDLAMNGTKDTARRYSCEEPGLQSVSVELVVLASNPQCQVNVLSIAHHHFRVKMQCALDYSGNWKPIMEWKKSSENSTTDQNKPSKVQEYVTEHKYDNRIVSLLTVIGNQGTYGLKYSCTTRFNIDHKPTYTTATNIPEYSHTWSSPPINLVQDGNWPVEIIAGLTVATIILLLASIASISYVVALKQKQIGFTLKTTSDNIMTSKRVIATSEYFCDPNDKENEGHEYMKIGTQEAIGTPEYQELVQDSVTHESQSYRPNNHAKGATQSPEYLELIDNDESRHGLDDFVPIVDESNY